jgi:FAD/FMN-containing dehydrogenase
MVMRVLTATKTKFAIRSAGNLDIPGFNAVGSDGVVIALQNLNKKVLSADKRYATIGTGLTWKSIYSWIEPYGVQIVGGREPRVGAGGFLLGGMSFEHPSFRLVICANMS